MNRLHPTELEGCTRQADERIGMMGMMSGKPVEYQITCPCGNDFFEVMLEMRGEVIAKVIARCPTCSRRIPAYDCASSSCLTLPEGTLRTMPHASPAGRERYQLFATYRYPISDPYDEAFAADRFTGCTIEGLCPETNTRFPVMEI